MLCRVLLFIGFVASSLGFAGAGHDDMWIMLFAGETVGKGTWFLNHNGVPQEISTSVFGALLAGFASAVAPNGLELVCWKVIAWFPAIIAGMVFFEILNRACGRGHAVFWVFVLCCFPQWHYWAWGGLESGLFWLAALLFVYCLACFSQASDSFSAVILAVLASALSLVRADALWAPLVCLFAAMSLQGKSARFRFAPGIFACVFVGLFHCLRYYFTQGWLPNPAYAKASLSFESVQYGLAYLYSFHSETPLHVFSALAYPLAFLGIARLLHSLVDKGRSCPGVFEWSSLIIVLIDASTVVVGGDWMSYHRFAVRTLPLKLIVIALSVDRFLIRPELLRWDVSIKRIVASSFLIVALTGVTAEGVVERAGLYRMGSTITSADFEVEQGISHFFVFANKPYRRDSEILLPWLDSQLGPLVERASAGGHLPLKIASYQAGIFPRALRKQFDPAHVLFIDLAGLSDHRIGTLPGVRSPLGLYEGTHLWAESLALGSGALGKFLAACRPDIVYVFAASTAQLDLMSRAGYDVVYQKNVIVDGESHSAVIFASNFPGDGVCTPLGVS
jgi:hypothetical protein